MKGIFSDHPVKQEVIFYSSGINAPERKRGWLSTTPAIPGRTPPGAQVALQQSLILLAGKSHL